VDVAMMEGILVVVDAEAVEILGEAFPEIRKPGAHIAKSGVMNVEGSRTVTQSGVWDCVF